MYVSPLPKTAMPGSSIVFSFLSRQNHLFNSTQLVDYFSVRILSPNDHTLVLLQARMKQMTMTIGLYAQTMAPLLPAVILLDSPLAFPQPVLHYTSLEAQPL